MSNARKTIHPPSHPQPCQADPAAAVYLSHRAHTAPAEPSTMAGAKRGVVDPPSRGSTPRRLPTVLTVEQAADLLQVSAKTVGRWIAAGQLRSHRLGRAVRVTEEDLVSFLAGSRR